MATSSTTVVRRFYLPCGATHYHGLAAHPKGDWVRWEDHVARLRAAEARAERYRGALEAIESIAKNFQMASMRLIADHARRALADRGDG